MKTTSIISHFPKDQMDKVRYQYRIYPTQSQEHLLAKAFGCARVVWNDALALCHEAYKNGESFPQDLDKKVITQAKKTKERGWLAEVSNIVLQGASQFCN